MVDLSETFWLTLMATGAGILGLIIKKISSSKCDEINCWGIHIHRKVELEHDDVTESQDSKTNINNNI
jgi:hypothetical protein